MRKARYIRISTANQNLERQLVKKHSDEQLYIDVISGAIEFSKRDSAIRLLDDVKSGSLDCVSVASICRLGRNLQDIINVVEELSKNGVSLKVENLGIESIAGGKKNPTFDLIISVMANVAVMERETLLERQREGIDLAKAKGVYKGRVRGSKESEESILVKYKGVCKLIKQGYSIRKIAKLEDVSVGSVQKVKRILKEKGV